MISLFPVFPPNLLIYLKLFIDFLSPTNDAGQAFSFDQLLLFPPSDHSFCLHFLSVTSSCFGPLILQKPNCVSSAMHLIFTSMFCPFLFL